MEEREMGPLGKHGPYLSSPCLIFDKPKELN